MNHIKALVQMSVAALVICCAMAAQQPKTETAQRIPATREILAQENVNFELRERTAAPAIKSTLSGLRKDISAKQRTFTVGYTTALDLGLDQLAGTRIPKDIPAATIQAVNIRAQELMAIDRRSAEVAHIQLQPAACNAGAKSFDWRSLGKVSPVKAQICGTCWDFTSMGAYEGSYALRNNVTIDGSEQYILNCAHAGSCSGGWWMPVFDSLITTGTAVETDDPFTGNDHAACPTGTRTPYRASAWGFVSGDQWSIPAPAQVKAALCQHGPLATAVMVDGGFQAYTGGVFDEHDVHFSGINHGITIIGWDDNKGAWLIKNSWGTGWGESAGGTTRGYMWIKYNTNNVGIATAWVDAVHNRYVLLPDWFKILEKNKLSVRPLPGVRELAVPR